MMHQCRAGELLMIRHVLTTNENKPQGIMPSLKSYSYSWFHDRVDTMVKWKPYSETDTN